MNKFVITIAAWNANSRYSTTQVGYFNPDLVIPVPYIERSIRSAQQSYNQYRLIITDDASTDGTWDTISKVLTPEFISETHTIAIKNQYRVGVVANHYRMAQHADDEEIIVILDGDDQLIGPDVLIKLNEVYNDRDVWMTYGSFGYDEQSRNPDPNGDWRGTAAELQEFDRKSPFYCSHLRTYKKWLFDRIRLEDLKQNGDFYQMLADHVITFPMIEMAGPQHARYIHEILYLYNAVNPYNEFKGPGAWPSDTLEHQQIKEDAEKELEASPVLIYDKLISAMERFRSLPSYPRLKRKGDWPYDNAVRN